VTNIYDKLDDKII